MKKGRIRREDEVQARPLRILTRITTLPGTRSGVQTKRRWLWLAEKAISHALLVRVPVPVILVSLLFDTPNLIEQN
jgi:hypothetical protein